MKKLADSINFLNAVAMGDLKANLVFKNCSLVNVYSGEIENDIQIAIARDRIAYVGPNATHTIGPKSDVIDLKGRFVCPGFADPHTHIDQFVLPSELAKKSLTFGTTTLFSDPIDIVSVCGYDGFKAFIKLTQDLPIRIFHVVPGGLPVDRKFSHSKTMTFSEQKSATKLPNVLGLGEVFSWTKVTFRDSKTMKLLSYMLDSDCIINGHTAGASGKKLQAYVTSGILSCHEPINFEQVIERLRLGMWIMIREGSIRRDLKNIVPQILSSQIYKDRLMFCSDGLDPKELCNFGHIDYCVNQAIKIGMNPIDAITIASKNCFDYYGLSKDLGGIAPGKLADLLIFDDLKSIKPKSVFVGGKLVVSDGKLVTKILSPKIPNWLKQTIKIKKFIPSDFDIKSKKKQVTVNTIIMQTEIITKLGVRELFTRDNNVVASSDKDIWKVAAFDRFHGLKKGTIGFLENFGANVGAFASTWSFHENDLIIIGSNESDMAIAANELKKANGGMILVTNGKVVQKLPLQLAGIISSDSIDQVYDKFNSLNISLIDSGCKFKKPHLIPLFLPFLALPELRILHTGLVDVKKRQYLDILE